MGLSNRILVWFGLISYPLYLWHWPLLSFARIAYGETPPRDIRLAAVLLSVGLAAVTYYFIEKPVRFGSRGKVKAILLLAIMLAAGGAGFTLYALEGVGSRFKDRYEFINYFENSPPEFKFSMKHGIFEKYRTDCDFYDIEMLKKGKATQVPIDSINPACYRRDPEKPKAVFIWGDSHAQQLYYGLNKNLPEGWQVLEVASSGCAPSIDTTSDPKSNYCAKSNRFALEAIKLSRPDVVILAQDIEQQAQRSKEISDRLKSMGIRNIIFTGPTPHWKSELPKIIARRLWSHTPERTYIGIDRSIMEGNTLLKNEFSASGLDFVDVISAFCNADGCLTRIGNDRLDDITSHDNAHLLPISSDYLAKNLLVPEIIKITGAH